MCPFEHLDADIWEAQSEMRSSVRRTSSCLAEKWCTECTGCHCGDSTTSRIHHLCERNHVQVEIPHSNNKWTSGCFQDSRRRNQLQTGSYPLSPDDSSRATRLNENCWLCQHILEASHFQWCPISSALKVKHPSVRPSHSLIWFLPPRMTLLLLMILPTVAPPFGWRAWPGWGISYPGCCIHLRSASQCSFSM